jgi:hypothetical protein
MYLNGTEKRKTNGPVSQTHPKTHHNGIKNKISYLLRYLIC